MNFHCNDCGMNCSFHATETDEHKLSEKVIEHLRTVHEMDVIPAEVLLKVNRAIRKQKGSDKDHTELATVPLAA